jgi:CubicO group peptidase (beta-lactamase class C family)
MRYQTLALTILAVTLSASPRVSADQAPPDAPATPLAGFDDYVAQSVRDWKTTGLAVAVVKDGQIVFAKGYGVRRLGSPEPIDDRTLFAVGSTTKAMTAAAIGMLVDEGKVAWDDPVIKHLPWFALKDPYMTREIRVRDLLIHRAGVPNTDFLWYEQPLSAREIIGRLRDVELETSPRTHFTYQNVMYAVAGEVVAAACGMPWAEFVRTRIFAPLGMSGTIATAATLAEQPNVATPHYEIDGTVQVIRNASVDGVAPAGSVWSSVRDMAPWLNMLLARGTVGGSAGKRLLSEKVVAELFTPQPMVGPDAFYPTARLTTPHWTTYGLGWFQADYGGEKVDFHTGSIDGMVAIAGLIRDRHLGVFVLANLDHAELRHALMYRVFDAYLGRPARDWSADMRVLYAGLAKEAEARRAKVEAGRIMGTKPSLTLDRYAGTYTHPLYGSLNVTVRDGRLHAQFGTGFVGPLEHWHYDTFKATWEARWRGTSLATFSLDAGGKVSGLASDQGRFTRVEP